MSAPLVTVKWHGKEIADKVHAVAAKALFQAAEQILEAANRIVPHEIGHLQETGETDIDERKLEASIYYDTPYAVVQHENLDFKHAAGREAKYLEKTFNEREQAAQEYIAGEIRKAHGG